MDRTGKKATVETVPANDAESAFLLELCQIEKTYRAGGAPVRALEPFSLALRASESVALVGESGAGKTTAARIAAKLDMPTSGRVFWAGEEVTALKGQRLRAVRSRVQYVAQDPARTFDPRWSIGASIAEALVNFRICAKAEAPEHVAGLLESVQLPHAAMEALPDELSGGQLQRASIARALACRPQALVLDEVTSALDMTVQGEILKLMESVRARTGAAFLFITHDLAVAQRMADRIVVMRQGRQVAECPSADLARCADPYVQELISSTLTLP